MAVVAAVVACVVAVCVCAFVVFDPSCIELVKQRAIARRIATIALDQRRCVLRRRWRWRWRVWWWRVCTSVCVCVIVAPPS